MPFLLQPVIEFARTLCHITGNERGEDRDGRRGNGDYAARVEVHGSMWTTAANGVKAGVNAQHAGPLSGQERAKLLGSSPGGNVKTNEPRHVRWGVHNPRGGASYPWTWSV